VIIVNEKKEFVSGQPETRAIVESVEEALQETKNERVTNYTLPRWWRMSHFYGDEIPATYNDILHVRISKSFGSFGFYGGLALVSSWIGPSPASIAFVLMMVLHIMFSAAFSSRKARS